MQRRSGITVMEELPSDASHRSATSAFPLALVLSTQICRLPLCLRVVGTFQLLLPVLLQRLSAHSRGCVELQALGGVVSVPSKGTLLLELLTFVLVSLAVVSCCDRPPCSTVACCSPSTSSPF